MHIDPWRLTVRLKSRRVLKQFMEHHKLTGRGLARKAGITHAKVGHLLRDPKFPTSRSTCNIDTAHAIEDALGCPRGMLFEPSLSSVADGKATRRAAA